ncbi:hypothetical protein PILCRDRAFT_784713 [Piloderma croceum F 1598]|uniref:Carboxypeptidase n=1 Tax=Piloderma croceum (strain F 1598) TaxID=765440 RepID=A0A0C3FW50_PILCF|nr:hypothetical protein PILCRDRAFT_784713 [Piloderma croceum F 1598]
MQSLLSWSVTLFFLVITCVDAAPKVAETVVHQQFTSKNNNGTKLRYVNDSGVCETTSGVHQVSGYVDIGINMSIWFWFFESRNSPETSPFTMWFNGGPGCSSMIGHIYSENGPCTVNADGKSTSLNPWNNISNMIYIDQPVGTGFSYGTELVNSTGASGPPVWTTLQLLFESGLFDKYLSRELNLASESYGGHYAPNFVTYFDEQNTKIDQGTVKGEKIVISTLLINNGWFDPLIQNQAYVDFATNAPGYGQLQNDSVIKQLNNAFYGKNGCKDQEGACYAAGTGTSSNKVCRAADNYCGEYIFNPAVGDRDSYDLRQNASALFPPEYYTKYLADPSVLKKIGATSRYSECSDSVGANFAKTADDARTILPELSALVNSRLKTLIWAGDADINCNWLGGHASVLAMDWYGNETLHNTPMTNITIDGAAVAAVQNVDHFSFARVYGAGHEVPAFKPKAALEIFSQIINKEQLHSV